MNKTFEKYQRLAREAQLSRGTLKSKDWFRKLVARENNIKNIDKITEGLREPDRLKVGQIVVFSYSAKTAEFLEYWDAHPLVMVTEIKNDGWIGNNFHYMHPMHRARMLHDAEKTRLQTHDQDTPYKHEQLKFCQKRYLATHARRVREVPKEYWDLVIQMPFEAFVNTSKMNVWKDTTRKSKKR